MRNRILLLLLLPGALCCGQTTPTAPGEDTTVCPTGPGPVPEGLESVCPPATSTVPNPGTTSYPQGTTPQAGTLPSGNNSLPVPAPSIPIPYKAVGPITTRTEFQIFAEDEAGHYEPVAVVATINEAEELAKSDMHNRIRSMESGGDAGICPIRYKLWARGIDGDHRVANVFKVL